MTPLTSLGLKLTTGIFSKFEKWIDTAPLVFALVLLTVVIFFVGSVFLTISQGWAGLLRALNVTPSVSVVDTPTLIGGIKPLGQFVSVSYQVASAHNRVDIRSGAVGACNQWAEYAFVVEVQAGTDLSKLEADDVSFDEAAQVYSISLPQPTLTSCNVYDNYSRYADHLPQVICPWYEQDFRTLGEYQVVEKARELVLAEGILDDVRRENEQTLSAFFEAVTGRPVVFHYQEGEPEYAQSCQPAVPDGWTKNVESNGTLFWTQS